jgi:hypothetical protein
MSPGGKIYKKKISEFRVSTLSSVKLYNTDWAILDILFCNKPIINSQALLVDTYSNRWEVKIMYNEWLKSLDLKDTRRKIK